MVVDVKVTDDDVVSMIVKIALSVEILTIYDGIVEKSILSLTEPDVNVPKSNWKT